MGRRWAEANNGLGFIDCVNCCHSFEKSYARFLEPAEPDIDREQVSTPGPPHSGHPLGGPRFREPLKLMMMRLLFRFRWNCNRNRACLAWVSFRASITFSSIAFMSSSLAATAVSTNLNPPLGLQNNLRFYFFHPGPIIYVILSAYLAPSCPWPPLLCLSYTFEWGTPHSFSIFPNPIWLLSRANFCIRLLIFVSTPHTQDPRIIAAMHWGRWPDQAGELIRHLPPSTETL